MVDTNQQEISITEEQLCLATIYLATGMKPLWVTTEGPGFKAKIIRNFLENAAREGLDPDDYNIAEIRDLWGSGLPDDLARLDTALTLNLLTYIHDMTHGRIAPYQKDPRLFAEAGDKHFRPVETIQQVLDAPDLDTYLASLPPSHHYYVKLRAALQHYKKLAATTNFVAIGAGPLIFPGNRDIRIKDVRQRLAGKGLYDEKTGDEELYDEPTVAAVQKFQGEFGIETDGIIGPKTLAALNTSPAETVQKILINMARWRWQENDLGRRYIIVNIANFDLGYFENDEEKISMAAIVGQLQHQTPVFSDRVQYLDFNPFWNIPATIARNEELPALREDPFHLVSRHVRLFSGWGEDAIELDSTLIDWQAVTPREMNRYRLRQDPGPWNALGPVKFVFPNHHDVYIHGTPAQDLFEKTVRSFSHGCIRASRPLELAVFVLAQESGGWTLERIREVVATGERKVVKLSVPVPVHITYQTVWVDNAGEIHFNNDNYGRDQKLTEILFNRKSRNNLTN